MESKPSAPKKIKFVPKAPARRRPKPVVPKTEVVDDAENAEAKELIRRFNDGLPPGKFKNERKSAPVRVAFGAGSSNNYYNSSKPSSSKNQDGANPFSLKPKKEYEEPWDYDDYYPATLPLRRPYSGNPDVLDGEEFGSPFDSFDEKRMSSAIKLGLMDELSEPRLMMFQLPKTVPLPVMKQEEASGSNPPTHAIPPQRRCVFIRDLPQGLMGKLLVYNSGKVKLKLGDALYDVNPGSDCKFAEDGVIINSIDKSLTSLGQIHKHAVVTPDVDSILDSIESVDSILVGLANADLG